jgi:hypothetical protein
MNLYRNGRRAYSSKNFRRSDGLFQWEIVQRQWAAQPELFFCVLDRPTMSAVISALGGETHLTRALGGSHARHT